MSTLNVSYIMEITRRDFAERFAGSVLGSLWAIIWPMVNLFIYIVIFGKVMGARLPGTSQMNAYGIYLAAGLIPWTAFAATINRSASVFLEKKHIITKVNTSFSSLLLHINLSETITYGISMLVFFIILVFQGYDFHGSFLLIPFLYYLQQLLALGLGLFAAVLNVFIRDVREITGVILQLWFWFTPIVYIPDILPSVLQKFMIYNPAYILIQSYHRIFVFNDYPPFKALVLLTVMTHFVLFFSFLMLRYLEKDIRDFL
ncbi:ABC transporter permease [Desulfobacula phenolica]|uniref:Transport permease protein n=1 Tax=Desulfobacula phenolica TaxID=90732 RepID=A0A1H2DP59_9BACT|nr:ABC transporter permease [Desulfobacula phenolica]SDT84665.1 lipopolysaccharide transport system permease protein [Desulfobacula phenolica]